MTYIIFIGVYLTVGILIGDSILSYGKNKDPDYNSIVTHPKIMLLILAVIWPIFIILDLFKK